MGTGDSDHEENNPDSDEAHISEDNDAVDKAARILFAKSSLLTADLRLNRFPEYLEPSPGFGGNVKFSAQKDHSSVLEVPCGAYLRVKFDAAALSNIGDKSHMHTYTIVLDMQINLQNHQREEKISVISYEWPRLNENSSGIVVTQEGIVKTSPLNAFENSESGARMLFDRWHRVTITKSLEDKVLSTYIDGDYSFVLINLWTT
jgi:hypothetical protein